MPILMKRLMLASTTIIAALAILPGCEKHQVVEFGSDIVADDQAPMRVTQPTAIRIRRDCRVVSYRIEPWAIHPGMPATPAEVALHNSEPEIYVTAGVVFAAGLRPVVKSERIVAAASGTEFIFVELPSTTVVIVNKAGRSRSAHAVTVSTRDGKQRKELDAGQGAFIDPSSGTLKEFKHPISDQKDAADQIRNVLVKVGVLPPVAPMEETER